VKPKSLNCWAVFSTVPGGVKCTIWSRILVDGFDMIVLRLEHHYVNDIACDEMILDAHLLEIRRFLAVSDHIIGSLQPRDSATSLLK
jgi:hypothetical protein